MNYILKKAGMSMVTGAAYVVGSWCTKQILDDIKDRITKHDKKQNKEVSPA